MQKVLKLHILKPADGMTWPELGKLLKDVRYRVFRLANLMVSEAYLDFHRLRKEEPTGSARVSKLNFDLLTMMKNEKSFDAKMQERICKTGALPDTVKGALSQYKIQAIKSKSKWSEITRGQASLPTFRLNMAIPVRCDKSSYRRLMKNGNDVEVELMVCNQPYPRVVLQTGKIGDGAQAVLDRLLENKDQKNDGYRQRYFEIKQEELSGKWWLHICYDFPPAPAPTKSKDRIVGVDLGFSCPLYAAINNGHARMGRRQMQPLGYRIRSLQNETIRRRREIQRGGNAMVSEDTARSGHGRKRKLKAIEKLEGRINRAYTTLNHQMSAAVVKFAKDHGAGVIQMEDLEGLKGELSGTFIGEHWRYYQLQNFILYKAKETGIEVRKVNPRYTSRRCSECGHIWKEFDREYRDKHSEKGKPARFICPECKYEADPDYNAARNLATVDIENLIRIQCRQQGLEA